MILAGTARGAAPRARGAAPRAGGSAPGGAGRRGGGLGAGRAAGLVTGARGPGRAGADQGGTEVAEGGAGWLAGLRGEGAIGPLRRAPSRGSLFLYRLISEALGDFGLAGRNPGRARALAGAQRGGLGCADWGPRGRLRQGWQRTGCRRGGRAARPRAGSQGAGLAKGA
jgi:hypothetical protein